jgi:GNAT superfamily N-acetyltransferase
MKVVVHPLTAQRWPDLETIFLARGCSIAKGCWCMYYRRSGKPEDLDAGESRSEKNRADLLALAAKDPPPGLIGYDGRTPIGWISLGPREDYAKLQRSPVMKPVDDQTVWSIICFVVPPTHQRNGVAKGLLAGAIQYARKRGVKLLEAYPVDLAAEPSQESLWFGTKSMFDAAGFEEIARRKPGRPVMRLRLRK